MIGERFRYRAATPEGKLIHGVTEATSRQNLLEQLRERNLYPVSLEAIAHRGDKVSSRGLHRHNAVALWSRNFATLLGAGVPVERALTVTAQQAGNQGLEKALYAVRRSVREGSSVADALGKHHEYFSSLMVGMVAAGEASGALEKVFEQLAAYLEETADLRAQVSSALIYPALMATVATVGVIVLLLFVVPRFTAILSDAGASLPLATRLLVLVGNVLTRLWWLLLGAVIAVIYVVSAAAQRPAIRKKWHRWLLHRPLLGDLLLKFTTARFAGTLGMLLKSGVSVVPALRIARSSVTNTAAAEAIEIATAEVSEGRAVAPALAGTIPPLAVHMLAVGEESGRLEEMCERVAETYTSEVRRALRSAVALIEPIMVLTFGVIIGLVALAMLQAIYSINTSAF